jgi:hypothetical protein
MRKYEQDQDEMTYRMDEPGFQVAITIRPTASEDADGIAGAFIESAEYHAGLDPERYST